jgi:hypothetical protein
MGESRKALQGDELRELSTLLARLVIGRAAPDELLTFDEVAEEYYADPKSAIKFNKKDEAAKHRRWPSLTEPLGEPNFKTLTSGLSVPPEYQLFDCSGSIPNFSAQFAMKSVYLR